MIADTSGLVQLIGQWSQRIPAHLKGFVEQVPFIVQAYISSEMTDLGPDAVFNPGPKLGIRRGDLIRSYLPGKPQNASTTQITSTGAVMRIRSTHPGAVVHETGRPAFIRSKGRMHKFFWAKYAETRKLSYKIMALSVIKRGGIRVKARPSIGKGIAKFLDRGVATLQQRFVDALMLDWVRLHG